MVAFAGDVVDQHGSDPRWDRIGIVRYPSRAAFFAMQQRDDFKDQHVHKEAGMESTIVMSCLPVDGAPHAATPDGGQVVLRVRRFADAGAVSTLVRSPSRGRHAPQPLLGGGRDRGRRAHVGRGALRPRCRRCRPRALLELGGADEASPSSSTPSRPSTTWPSRSTPPAMCRPGGLTMDVLRTPTSVSPTCTTGTMPRATACHRRRRHRAALPLRGRGPRDAAPILLLHGNRRGPTSTAT